MAILNETTGPVMACDGCGRTDAGPNQPLHIAPYVVQDPNIGSGVQHHYCAGCAANRGLSEPVRTIAGWEAAPVAGTPVMIDPSSPGDVQPGTIDDPVAYAAAIERGEIIPIEQPPQ